MVLNIADNMVKSRQRINKLQALLKLRGVSIRSLARQIGHDYTQVHKVVRREPYRSKYGSVLIRKNPVIRKKIAVFLGIEYHKIWGENEKHLDDLIKIEIEKKQKMIADRYRGLIG